jgi:hypothetical protein
MIEASTIEIDKPDIVYKHISIARGASDTDSDRVNLFRTEQVKY